MSKRKAQSEKCKVKVKNSKFLVLSFSFTLCALSFALNCFAVDEAGPSALFYKANIAYGQGKFDDAVKMYEDALVSDFESGSIYYNLGNAYFKKGETGKAILNYKRAERLIPQDADLRANLDHATSLIEQQNSGKTGFFIEKWVMDFIEDVSIDGFAELLIALYMFVFLSAAAFISIKSAARFIKWPLIICCVLLIISAAGFFFKISQINQPWAIIVDKEVEARYEPFESATVHFSVFQGNEALLLKQKDSWAFIKRPDGKAGWIKASNIEKI